MQPRQMPMLTLQCVSMPLLQFLHCLSLPLLLIMLDLPMFLPN
jgi:hypothetical protein